MKAGWDLGSKRSDGSIGQRAPPSYMNLMILLHDLIDLHPVTE